MAQKRIYTHDEVVNTLVGEKGTAKRDAYDLTIELFLVGQTIREIREKRNLTQEDLGNLIGVKKAQISRIENGQNLTVATILKVFKALDVLELDCLQLNIENSNPLSLWVGVFIFCLLRISAYGAYVKREIGVTQFSRGI